MTAITALDVTGDNLQLNPHENCHVRIEGGKPVAASRANAPLNLLDWQEGQPIEQVSENNLVITSPDVSMRAAIELRYRSGLPVLLCEGGQLVGMLSDRDFYHALLGKHFTQETTSDAA